MRYALDRATADAVLTRLTAEGRLVEGEFRPGGTEREWTDAGVLRMLRSRSLAKLRHEIEPVDETVLGRFVTTWHGVVKRRHGAEIHGVPIVAGFDGLAWVVHRHKIDKIVIGTRHLAPQAVALIQALAGKLGLEVAEVHFEVRWIAAPKLAIEPVVVAERSVGTAAGGNGDVGSLVAAAAGVGGGSNGNGNGHGAVADLRVAG